MRNATIFGALRRGLLAQGMTMKPRCPSCGFEREVRMIGQSGDCVHCELQRDLDAAKWDAYYGRPGGAPVTDPTGLGTGPFLPEED